MADRTFLNWPFFEAPHRELAEALEAWAARELDDADHEEAHVGQASRELVARLGAAGWLRHAVPQAYGGASPQLEVRSLCLLRETLARHDGLADFAFAMQALGSAPISLYGGEALCRRYLPGVAAGEAVAAFALTEPDAGSDVAALATTARREGDHYVLDGGKTFISNAGIADFYVVFARTGEAPGAKGLSAMVVEADTPGLEVTERQPVTAPHPLGALRLSGCRVPADRLVGRPGDGFRVAMGTLDVLRSSVGAAALGFARRALDEALQRVQGREVFGQAVAEFQMTQQKLADMAVEVDASALLIYRAAWTRDCVADRVTREAAMAKLYATEAAQRVIDQAVQLFGGTGVLKGSTVERLYREIRPLRIYEGTSEIQKLIIARQALAAHAEPPAPGTAAARPG